MFLTTADGAIDLSRYYISVFHSNHAVMSLLTFCMFSTAFHACLFEVILFLCYSVVVDGLDKRAQFEQNVGIP